jgi:hypothetical protein
MKHWGLENILREQGVFTCDCHMVYDVRIIPTLRLVKTHNCSEDYPERMKPHRFAQKFNPMVICICINTLYKYLKPVRFYLPAW